VFDGTSVKTNFVELRILKVAEFLAEFGDCYKTITMIYSALDNLLAKRNTVSYERHC
jgi:hypothetical protein